jgi:hypothetical protein
MALQVKVIADHLVFDDGCKINTDNSNITARKGFKGSSLTFAISNDALLRETSSICARRQIISIFQHRLRPIYFLLQLSREN